LHKQVLKNGLFEIVVGWQSGRGMLRPHHQTGSMLKASRCLCLLEGIHQARDGPIEVFVGAPQLFDFIDRVQYRSVVLSAKLTANLW